MGLKEKHGVDAWGKPVKATRAAPTPEPKEILAKAEAKAAAPKKKGGRPKKAKTASDAERAKAYRARKGAPK